MKKGIMSKKLKIYKSDETSISIPLFTSPVKAGFPSPAEDFIEETLDLNKYLIKHPAATFFVKVEGDSMIDANIFKNDILIIDRSLSPQDKKIVIAILNGEFTVKRIRILKNKIYLQPENKNYSQIEIPPNSDFEIWGVVTHIIHQAL